MTQLRHSLAIMQPYFMPYIGYFQLMDAVETFVLFDDVNFIKKGWIHRNRILTNQGEHLFTLPLINSSQNKTISEHKLLDSQTFYANFKRTLELNYKKSPCFNQGMSVIDEIFAKPEDDLTTLCETALRVCANLLDIHCSMVRASSLDYDRSLKASAKIREITQHLSAETYVNLSGGRELYQHADFAHNGIDLKFIKTTAAITYPQIATGFVSNLSLIDLLMSVPLSQIKLWIKNYELTQ